MNKYLEYALKIGLLMVFFILTDIGCFIRNIFGFPCPACGMTSAILSLLQGDIAGYVHHNAFALPVLVAAIILIYVTISGNKKKLLLYIPILILVLNLIYYLVRIFYS